MSHAVTLGILPFFSHYPALRTDMRIDPRLLGGLGLARNSVLKLQVTDLDTRSSLPDPIECDLWVLSGAPGCPGHCWNTTALAVFLQAATKQSRPVFALNHAEHALHLALCPDRDAPTSARWPRSVRNPFLWFGRRERVFAFDPILGEVLDFDPHAQSARAA